MFCFSNKLLGDEKQILYNNVEWNRLWGRWYEPPPITPNARLFPKKVMLCIWKRVLYYELLPENQMIDSSKYQLQLDQLKVSLSGNHPELVNRIRIIFNQDNAKTTYFFDDQAKTVTVWVRSSDSPTICTRHCTYFGPYKIVLSGKYFNSLEDCKRHLEQLFAQKDTKFSEDEIVKWSEKWQKIVE